MKSSSFIVVALLSLSALTCKKETPTAPPSALDTTSHNWNWQTFAFGGASSSTFYDIAIINDTLAYAVGAIYLYDSTGQVDQQPYNLAMWDGRTWKLQKLFANGFPPPIKSIIAVGQNDIWFDPWFHWDGQHFQVIPSDPIFFAVGISKMWGDQSGIYVVGTTGFIARRMSSGSWIKIESGTTLDFQDIYGAINSQTNQTEIVAVASQLDINKGNMIVSIEGATAVPINSGGLSWSIVGVWFVPGQQYYIVGDGIGQKKSLQDMNPWNVSPTGTLAQAYSAAISGNGTNDVVVVGSFGDILHYNGSTWKDYSDQTYTNIGSYGSV